MPWTLLICWVGIIHPDDNAPSGIHLKVIRFSLAGVSDSCKPNSGWLDLVTRFSDLTTGHLAHTGEWALLQNMTSLHIYTELPSLNYVHNWYWLWWGEVGGGGCRERWAFHCQKLWMSKAICKSLFISSLLFLRSLLDSAGTIYRYSNILPSISTS